MTSFKLCRVQFSKSVSKDEVYGTLGSQMCLSKAQGSGRPGVPMLQNGSDLQHHAETQSCRDKNVAFEGLKCQFSPQTVIFVLFHTTLRFIPLLLQLRHCFRLFSILEEPSRNQYNCPISHDLLPTKSGWLVVPKYSMVELIIPQEQYVSMI